MSILLVACYDYLPKKQLNIETISPSRVYANTDAREGGDTEFEWIDQQENAWLCRVNGDTPYPFCSLTILLSPKDTLDSVDLSNFDDISINLDYSGDSNYIRFFIRNSFQHDKKPESSEQDSQVIQKLEGAKFNFVNIETHKFYSPVSISSADLRVADWWIEQFDVKPIDTKPDISDALAIGIDVPFPFPKGEHAFSLHSISMTGKYLSKETLYLLISVLLGLALISEMLFHYINLRLNVNTKSVQISKLNRENKLFKELAHKDNLSGAYNRQGLERVLVELNNKQQLDDFAIVIIDIDNFKQVNDTYGHVCGDGVICATVNVIKDTIRNDDVVARWGGEEFVILLRCDSQSNLSKFCQKLSTAIKAPPYPELPISGITASGGAAMLKEHATFDAAFEHADTLLYKAKNNGKDTIVC
ncbi:GGDEF domain-containing protein [Agaribacter flavus]|uniref:diguanylate cyclase n=1 Tax=Agaribacter flavus TaxID=1902781 RepID=A0ABV7FR61_9ALTE